MKILSISILLILSITTCAQDQYHLVYESTFFQLTSVDNDSVVNQKVELDSINTHQAFYFKGILKSNGSTATLKGINWAYKERFKIQKQSNHLKLWNKVENHFAVELNDSIFRTPTSDRSDWYLVPITKSEKTILNLLSDGYFLKLYTNNSFPEFFIDRMNEMYFQTYSSCDIWYGDFLNIEDFSWSGINITEMNTEFGNIHILNEQTCNIYPNVLIPEHPIKYTFQYDAIPNISSQSTGEIKTKLVGNWKSASSKFYYQDSVEFLKRFDYSFSIDSAGYWKATTIMESIDSTTFHSNDSGTLLISGTGNYFTIKMQGRGTWFHFYEFIADKLKVQLDRQSVIVELMMVKDSNKH